MGREVRMVPVSWEHPKDENGRYIPLYGGSYSESVKEWDEEAQMWELGKRRKYGSDEWVEKDEECTYEEWAGQRPNQSDYMPDWDDSERTHFMMYEDTSEGTPISPAFETPEELAKWLADTGASSFGGDTATYEQWLYVCKGGWAPSAVYSPQAGLISGVAASTELK